MQFFLERISRRRLAASICGCCALIATGLPARAALQAGAPAAKGAGRGAPTPVSMPPEMRQAEAQFGRAVALHQAGQWQRALDAYRDYLHFVSIKHINRRARVPALLNMALLYAVQSKNADEEQALREVASIDPRNATALAELSALEASCGHDAEAVSLAKRAAALNPPPALAAPAHFALGLVAFRQNRLATAEMEFTLSAKLAPERPQTFFDLALVYNHEQKWKPALDAVNKAVSLGFDSEGVLLARAYILARIRDLNGAIGAYSQILARDPRCVQAEFARAMIEQELGRRQEAISDYLRVLDLQPDHTMARRNVAGQYYALGNYTAAKDHFAALHARFPKDAQAALGLGLSEMEDASGIGNPAQKAAGMARAESVLKAAVALAPSDPRLEEALATFYERSGRFDDAVAIHKRRISAAPKKVDGYYALARVYTMERKPAAVVDVWQQYRALRPEDPVSYVQAARILESSGDYTHAIDQWQQLLTREPANGEALNAVGQDQYRLKQYKAARLEYERTLSPEVTGNLASMARVSGADVAAARARRIAAFQGLAQVAHAEQKPAEEIDCLIKARMLAVSDAKGSGQPPKAEFFRAVAQACETAGQADRARQEYAAWAKALPTDPDPFDMLAHLEDMQNREEQAVQAYRKAAERSHDPVRYRIDLAEMLHRRKHLDEAIAEYEAMAAHYPGDARVCPKLAQVCEQAGKDEKALAAWTAAVKTNPDADWVKSNRAKVLLRLKRYDEARVAYEQELDAHPNNIQTYSEIAHVYDVSGKGAAFLSWIQARFEKDPNREATMRAVLNEFERQKREDAAWPYLRGVVERHGCTVQSVEALSGLYAEHNRDADALDLYRSLAARRPTDTVVQRGYAERLYSAGKTAEASALLDAQIRRTDVKDSDREPMRRTLLSWYRNQHKWNEALSQARALLQAHPGDLTATSVLADVLTEAGQSDEAVRLLSERSRDTALPSIFRARLMVRAAAICEKAGKKVDAVSQYRAALAVDSHNPEATSGLKRLGETH